MINKKIGFIGAGNMGEAMIAGLVRSKIVEAQDIFISNRTEEKLEKLKTQWGDLHCTTDNREIAEKCDIIVLSVKPGVYKTVIEEIKDLVNMKKIILTVAAGVTIADCEKMFSSPVKIARTMPNTPALIGQGVTAYCLNSHVDKGDEKILLEILSTFGIVEKIKEEFFHAVIALSGSSPAYVFMMIEAMADGAVLQGIPRAQALRMASAALMGSAAMVAKTGVHPGQLKDSVCSPGGTTIEAVRTLEQCGFRSTLIEAMERCAAKSREMSESL